MGAGFTWRTVSPVIKEKQEVFQSPDPDCAIGARCPWHPFHRPPSRHTGAFLFPPGGDPCASQIIAMLIR
jgi:hypothetical protein